jgi:hypothetical protein
MIRRRFAISRARLVEALATGRPLGAVARDLGCYDRQSLLKLMGRLGVTRTVSKAGVVTIVAGEAVR